MKKILLVIFAVAAISALHAQASFGIQAGATFASEKAKFGGVSFNLDTKVGFTAGVVASVPLASDLSFDPSLNFTQKGGKTSAGGDELKETLNYIELPLNFVYNFDAGAGDFFVGLGPSLSVGVSGKDKSGSESVDVNFGSNADELKAFEFGGNILAGYKLENGIFIAVNYNAGLSNLSNDSDAKVHNNYFGVRVGYMFGGKGMKKDKDKD
ncbi:MAG: porin family protein [Parafilimonas sp.]